MKRRERKNIYLERYFEHLFLFLFCWYLFLLLPYLFFSFFLLGLPPFTFLACGKGPFIDLWTASDENGLGSGEMKLLHRWVVKKILILFSYFCETPFWKISLLVLTHLPWFFLISNGSSSFSFLYFFFFLHHTVGTSENYVMVCHQK